jgi:hypothetical protein
VKSIYEAKYDDSDINFEFELSLLEELNKKADLENDDIGS